MSMGKNKQESSQSMDPQIKGALMNVFQTGQSLSRTPYNPYQFARVAPMSPFQQQGMQATVDAANAGIGQSQMNEAITAARGVAQFNPSQVGAQQIGQQANVGNVSANNVGARNVNADAISTRFGVAPTQAGSVTTNAIQDQQLGMDRIGPLGILDAQQVGAGQTGVNNIGPASAVQTGALNAGNISDQAVAAERVNAGQVRDTNLGDYMSQYQTGVIDSALGDIERSRKMQQNQNAAQAQSAGAFGGDRAAIVEAETNRAALDQSARTASQLRQSGFENATRMAESDLARQASAAGANQQAGLQSQLANQSTNLAAQQANAQFGLQAGTEQSRQALQSGLAAQDINRQFAMANQQANLSSDQANAARAMQAQQLNQAAGLQAGQFNIGNDMTRQQLNQATRNSMEQAQMQGNLQAQQSTQANMLSANQGNQDAGLRAALANQNASQAAQQMRMQAQQANQGANLQAGLANQSNYRQTGLANQDANLRAGLANQQTNFGQAQMNQNRMMANQDASMRAALANQNAGLQAAQQRLSGAQMLGQFGQDMRGMTYGDAQQLQGVGNQQQQFGQQIMDDQYARFQEQQNYPFQMFDVLRAGAGMLPNPTMSSSSGRGFNLSAGGG